MNFAFGLCLFLVSSITAFLGLAWLGSDSVPAISNLADMLETFTAGAALMAVAGVVVVLHAIWFKMYP